MPRYRVVRQAITRRDGVAEPGDEIDPTEAELRAFGDNLEAVADGDESDEDDDGGGEDEAPALCNTEMSDGDICKRPADDCPYH